MLEIQHSLPVGYWLDKTLEAGRGHDWEAHREGVLTLVLRGSLHESFPDRIDDCRPLELHWKPPGAVHRTVSGAEGLRMVLIAFRPEAVAGSSLGRRSTSAVVPRGPAAVRALQLLRDPDSARHAAAAGDVLHLADRLLSSPATAPRTDAPHWLRAARLWADQRASDHPSMSEIARFAGVHPGSLGRAFRRQFGTTVGEFLQARRLDRAVELLAAGERSLADVAAEAGFFDQSHLSRTFRRQTGSTPGRFRRDFLRLAEQPRSAR